jgi:hypothetical protein
MITKMPLENSGYGRHRESDERALMRIKTAAGFDQSGARDL